MVYRRGNVQLNIKTVLCLIAYNVSVQLRAGVLGVKLADTLYTVGPLKIQAIDKDVTNLDPRRGRIKE